MSQPESGPEQEARTRWEKYRSGPGVLRVTLPEDLGNTIRTHAEHYGLTPEQVICASLAVGLFNERAWVAALQAIVLCNKLPPMRSDNRGGANG